MANVAWTITVGSTTQTLEQAKVTSMTRVRTSQGDDSLSIVRVSRAAFGESVTGWASNARITVRRDGAVWFTGVLFEDANEADMSGETQTWEAVGPWYWLTVTEYQMEWLKLVDSVTGATQQLFTPHIITNYAGILNGAPLLGTTRQCIYDVASYCLSRVPAPAPFALDLSAILPGMQNFHPGLDEAEHMTCADVIRRQLRWHPDAVLWFDYAADPPTLRVDQRLRLPQVSRVIREQDDPIDQVNGDDAPTIERASVRPRYDLVRPGVRIIYVFRGTWNDQAWEQAVLDTWDGVAGNSTFAGTAPNSVDAIVNLAGLSATQQTSRIVVIPFPTPSQLSDTDWMAGFWADRKPNLIVDDCVITPLEAATANAFNSSTGEYDAAITITDPLELMLGQVFPWMHHGPHRAEYQKVRISQPVKIVHSAEKVKRVILTHDCCITNMVSGQYSVVDSADSGDPCPPISSATVYGAARVLAEAVAQLYWQGSITETTQDVPSPLDVGSLAIGKTLNLSYGSHPEWASMRGLIQQVTEDVVRGSVTASLGPPEQLGPADIVAHLTPFRKRLRWTHPGVMASGMSSDAGMIEGGEANHDANGQDGRAQRTWMEMESETGGKKLTLDSDTHVLKYNDGTKDRINMALAGLYDQDAGWREVKICEGATTRYMLVFGSGLYSTPKLPP